MRQFLSFFVSQHPIHECIPTNNVATKRIMDQCINDNNGFFIEISFAVYLPVWPCQRHGTHKIAEPYRNQQNVQDFHEVSESLLGFCICKRLLVNFSYISLFPSFFLCFHKDQKIPRNLTMVLW